MSRCLTVHRHMEVAAASAAFHDEEKDRRAQHPPKSTTSSHDDDSNDATTLKLFQTNSTDTLPCVHRLIKAHHQSIRTLRRVLKPPPPTLSVQFETLSSDHIELITGPIRDVCETLTLDHFSMVAPTKANVHMMGTDVFYVSLSHSETMMMGIFILPPHSKIPLHDHPHMSVVSRVYVGDLGGANAVVVAVACTAHFTSSRTRSSTPTALMPTGRTSSLLQRFDALVRG
ncbi:hypothetical protein AC1031_019348 [Aphanomyces cochlioides]|nr:hypothetical protein AC1031_019348 [Aphanomyces cochlioides]